MKRIILTIGLVLVAGVIHAALNPTIVTTATTNITYKVSVTNNTELFDKANEQVVLLQLRAITNKNGAQAFKNSATKNGKLVLDFGTNTINAVFIPKK